VASAAVEETAYCIYNKTEQIIKLLIKLVISRTSMSIFQLQQWKHLIKSSALLFARLHRNCSLFCVDLL
jgi:hypothetical protein